MKEDRKTREPKREHSEGSQDHRDHRTPLNNRRYHKEFGRKVRNKKRNECMTE